MNNNQVIVCQPMNLGWLESKLSNDVMRHLWKLIENKGKNMKPSLAGIINASYELNDKENWFFDNVLKDLCNTYVYNFGDIGEDLPNYRGGMRAQHNQYKKYDLKSMWVNFQKQTDYNPLHHHNGTYSFVIWMKIPTRHDDQNKNNDANKKIISSFQFFYYNILGEEIDANYEMNPEVEGTILFFPSKLRHVVNPFYNCDDDRISISGNIYETVVESVVKYDSKTNDLRTDANNAYDLAKKMYI